MRDDHARGTLCKHVSEALPCGGHSHELLHKPVVSPLQLYAARFFSTQNTPLKTLYGDCRIKPELDTVHPHPVTDVRQVQQGGKIKDSQKGAQVEEVTVFKLVSFFTFIVSFADLPLSECRPPGTGSRPSDQFCTCF